MKQCITKTIIFFRKSYATRKILLLSNLCFLKLLLLVSLQTANKNYKNIVFKVSKTVYPCLGTHMV